MTDISHSVFSIIYKFIFLALIFHACLSVDAQVFYVEGKNPDNYLVAEELFNKGFYSEAIDYYLKSLLNPEHKNDLALQYHLAECYRFCRLYEKAVKSYQLVVHGASDQFPLAIFWLGKMQKACENYDDAEKQFTYFLNNENNDKSLLLEGMLEQALCDPAAQLKKIRSSVKIESIGIGVNKEFNSDRGFLRHDTLWYTEGLLFKNRMKKLNSKTEQA